MVVINDSYKNDEWTIDLGSTSHISPNIRGMTNIRTYQASTDVAEENRTLEAEAIGDIGVITKINGQEEIIRIKDVLYVPRLKSNLLSVSKLNNEGIKITFKCGIAEMVDSNNEIIAKVSEHDGIYIFKAKPLQNCNQITGEELEIKAKGSVNQKMLWHKRLGYVCEAYMDKMKTNTSVRDLSYGSQKLEICEACTMEKLTQRPHKKVTHIQAKRPLELLHMDLYGPMPVRSRGGAKYLYVTVEEYSKYVRYTR